ncbi:MAG: hypothetical protein OXH75_15205 [Acidobacteria bacterium]|nr:hypothetical protein [Acidobacteriota bacterium]
MPRRGGQIDLPGLNIPIEGDADDFRRAMRDVDQELREGVESAEALSDALETVDDADSLEQAATAARGLATDLDMAAQSSKRVSEALEQADPRGLAGWTGASEEARRFGDEGAAATRQVGDQVDRLGQRFDNLDGSIGGLASSIGDQGSAGSVAGAFAVAAGAAEAFENDGRSAFEGAVAGAEDLGDQVGIVGDVLGRARDLLSGPSGLIGAFAAAAAGAYGLVEATAAARQELELQAGIAGINVREYEALSRATQALGADQDLIADVLNDVNERYQDALEGVETYASAFARLGIDLDDFGRQDRATRLFTLAEALSRVDDDAAQLSANELAGDQGQRLLSIVRQLGGALPELVAQFEDLDTTDAATGARLRQYEIQMGLLRARLAELREDAASVLATGFGVEDATQQQIIRQIELARQRAVQLGAESEHYEDIETILARLVEENTVISARTGERVTDERAITEALAQRLILAEREIETYDEINGYVARLVRQQQEIAEIEDQLAEARRRLNATTLQPRIDAIDAEIERLMVLREERREAHQEELEAIRASAQARAESAASVAAGLELADARREVAELNALLDDLRGSANVDFSALESELATIEGQIGSGNEDRLLGRIGRLRAQLIALSAEDGIDFNLDPLIENVPKVTDDLSDMQQALLGAIPAVLRLFGSFRDETASTSDRVRELILLIAQIALSNIGGGGGGGTGSFLSGVLPLFAAGAGGGAGGQFASGTASPINAVTGGASAPGGTRAPTHVTVNYEPQYTFRGGIIDRDVAARIVEMGREDIEDAAITGVTRALHGPTDLRELMDSR